MLKHCVADLPSLPPSLPLSLPTYLAPVIFSLSRRGGRVRVLRVRSFLGGERKGRGVEETPELETEAGREGGREGSK